MGNKDLLIMQEAERITDYIIKKRRHKLDSVKVVDEYMKKEFIEDRIKVHAYIPYLLTRKRYDIVSTDPLVVKKF